MFSTTQFTFKKKKKSQETFNIKSIFDAYFDPIYVIAWKNKDQLDIITNSWLSTENEDAIILSQRFFYALKFSTTWNFLIIKVKMKLCTSSVTSPVSLCWALISGCAFWTTMACASIPTTWNSKLAVFYHQNRPKLAFPVPCLLADREFCLGYHTICFKTRYW